MGDGAGSVENAEVFNYIYPGKPLGGILTGNHSCRSAIDIVYALCLGRGWEKAQGQMLDKNGTIRVIVANHYELSHLFRGLIRTIGIF